MILYVVSEVYGESPPIVKAVTSGAFEQELKAQQAAAVYKRVYKRAADDIREMTNNLLLYKEKTEQMLY